MALRALAAAVADPVRGRLNLAGLEGPLGRMLLSGLGPRDLIAALDLSADETIAALWRLTGAP